MKKKLLCNILTVVMVASMLTACDKTTTDNKEEVKQETQQSEVTDIKVEENVLVETGSKTSVSEGDFVTADLEDGTIQITKYQGEAVEVSVPDTINGKTVTSIAGFSDNKEILSVELPNTIKEICDRTFLNCVELRTVELNKDLEIIGEEAFSNCVELVNIEIPANIRSLGKRAFSGTKITNVTIPRTITEIERVFSLTCLEKVIIPNNIKTIGDQSFCNGFNLSEVNIENGVEKIGEYAFADCSKLEKVIIPVSVKEIDESAFSHSDNVVLYVESGSYAETFAQENDIEYVVQ